MRDEMFAVNPISGRRIVKYGKVYSRLVREGIINKEVEEEETKVIPESDSDDSDDDIDIKTPVESDNESLPDISDSDSDDKADDADAEFDWNMDE